MHNSTIQKFTLGFIPLIIALALLVPVSSSAEELEETAEIGNPQFIVQTVTPPNRTLVSIPMASYDAALANRSNRPDEAYWLDYYHQLLSDAPKKDPITTE